MTTVKTNFSPINDGFHFINYFELSLPKFDLPLVGKVDLTKLAYGLCGGMCFGVLDYYYTGKPRPAEADVKKIDQKLFTYLCTRQLDSLMIATLFRVLEWMMKEEGEIGQRMAKNEIPKLRRMLDRGDPAVLVLVRGRGAVNPTENHQVLAIGYDFDPVSKHMTVFLYDPNHPRKEPTITLNLSNPSQGLSLAQSTGETLFGFFVNKYKPEKKPPVFVAAAVSFEAPVAPPVAGINLRWPVDSSRVNQYFGENPASYRPFKLPGHEGLDLYAPSGANVYAAADGVVYQTGQPPDHPYGLHVRIRHTAGKRVFHTIYAHLSQAKVQINQRISAGDLIGLADNSGNSFGSHLHLTLKIDGEQTAGYPAGIVDPLPYLQAGMQPAPDAGSGLPAPSGVTLYTSSQVDLRAEPSESAKPLAMLPSGEALISLGDASRINNQVGKAGEWLLVQTASGLVGNAPAWQLQTGMQAFPPSDLVIYPLESVNLRSGPATTFTLLTTLSASDPLTVLGDADVARTKLGRANAWLQVQTANGQKGFVAGWLVHSTAQPVTGSGLAGYPVSLLNVRAQPATSANTLTVVTPTDRLAVLGDKDTARAAIGQAGRWLSVRTPSGYMGFAAAWLVREAGSTPPAVVPASGQMNVYPITDLNLRAQASSNSPRVTGAFRNDSLLVLEPDQNAARQKIGQPNQWIYVQAKDGQRGFAAAWFLSDNHLP
jgi:murein DD-endopeptidase MepM/ murein hydrolase activator NlpD/uncharacterized protein YgiM (DUF1202 family)